MENRNYPIPPSYNPPSAPIPMYNSNPRILASPNIRYDSYYPSNSDIPLGEYFPEQCSIPRRKRNQNHCHHHHCEPPIMHCCNIL